LARIRTIKPEFPESQSVGAMSHGARLCFILLWTRADDSGRLLANSRLLARVLYPYDDVSEEVMEGWLAEIDDQDCIRRYRVDGNDYIEIVNWDKHQKIDKPSGSKLPEFTQNSRIIREDSRGFFEGSRKVANVLASRADHDLGSGPRIRDLGSRIRKGKEEKLTLPFGESDEREESKNGKRFVRPTPQEAEEHFLKIGSSREEAAKFWNFYESQGWLVGKNPMKSWRAAAAGWVIRRKAEAAKGRGDGNPNSSSQTLKQNIAEGFRKVQNGERVI